jgi:hypothetical protein
MRPADCGECWACGAQTKYKETIGFDGEYGYYTDWDAGTVLSGVNQGLVNLQNRYYDPGAGRFFNRDPDRLRRRREPLRVCGGSCRVTRAASLLVSYS